MNNPFRKVTTSQVIYSASENTIRLHGVFASDELRAIADVMDAEFWKRRGRIKKRLTSLKSVID